MNDAEAEERKPVAEQTKTIVPARMADDALKTFVRDFLADKIFVAGMAPEDMWMSIFMPLGFGFLDNASEEEFKTIGTIYEYFDKAGPMGINGFPMFFSMKTVHAEDWKIIQASVKKARETDVELVKP